MKNIQLVQPTKFTRYLKVFILLLLFQLGFVHSAPAQKPVIIKTNDQLRVTVPEMDMKKVIVTFSNLTEQHLIVRTLFPLHIVNQECFLKSSTFAYEKPDIGSEKVIRLEKGYKIMVLDKVKTFFKTTLKGREMFLPQPFVDCTSNNVTDSILIIQFDVITSVEVLRSRKSKIIKNVIGWSVVGTLIGVGSTIRIAFEPAISQKDKNAAIAGGALGGALFGVLIGATSKKNR